MNRFRMILSAAVVVAFLVLAASVSFAQTSNGAIAGVISDKTGAVVPKATVSATSVGMGEKREATTDSIGSYRIEALIPGKYVVVVTAPGFAELKVSNIDVKASLTTTVNGTLEISKVGVTVTVEATQEQELHTQSAELSANITSQEIANIPIFGLNPITLVLTQPGVQSVASRDDFTNGVSFSVNGTRPRANNFLIDGQDNNDNSINGQAFQPINLEAVGEVTVLTNSYSAEFGRGGGSVTNVIYKGGNNEFHGSAWEIHRNSAVAAVPAEAALGGLTSNPVDIENQFGFSFGGPIRKNKLFFFGSSQWDRDRSAAGASTLPIRIPTANGVTTLQSLSPTQANLANVNFLIASLGGLRGQTNLQNIALGSGRPAVETGLIQRSSGSIASNDRQWNVRVDFLPAPSDTITARYIRDDSNLTPDFFNFPRNLPPFDTQQGGPSQSFGTTWVHIFSPKLVNEFRFSYTQINFTFGPTPQTAANPLFSQPAVTIAGIQNFPILGVPTGIAQSRGHDNWQYQDALNYTIGTHTFKIGIDIAHLRVVDHIPFNDRGTLQYRLGGGFTSLGNYIDDFTGAGGQVNKVFGSPVVRPFSTTYAPYVQDAWRIRPNFTLNLGLRYEYWGLLENALQFPATDLSRGFGVAGPFPDVHGLPQEPDKNNFAPRIGIAYTPRFWHRLFGEDKTVIRAGYGIFYDGLFTNILDNTAGASPNANSILTVGGSGRGTANARTVLAGFTSVQRPTNAVTTIDSRLRNPLTHQWNFDIERAIPGNFVVTAAYVGTRGERLFVNQEYNPRINFGARLNAARGAMTVRTNSGDSIYHAAQLKVDRKFSRGLLVRGSYTFSRLIDNSSEVFTTSGLSSFSQDPFNQAGDRGLSAFHRTHRLVLTYIWELPYVHKSDGGWAVLKAVTRDWQWSGTTSFQTGAPETVTVGFDVLGDGRGGNDRPSLSNPAAPFTHNGIDGTLVGLSSTPGTFFEVHNAVNCDDVTIPCLPAEAVSAFHFIIKDSGLGNVGRNTVLTNGRQDWSTAIQRTFKMPFMHLEKQALMFRAELFNAFNHPNKGIPSLTVIDDSFADNSQTIFGGRQIKFWLKYSF